MRIGIWCDYGFTLEPTAGIGVFVDNLVRGIMAADPDVHLTLKVHPTNRTAFQSVVGQHPHRIAVTCESTLQGPRAVCHAGLHVVRKVLREPDDGQPIIRRIDESLAACQRRVDGPRERQRMNIIAGCDVWLLPYVAVDQAFSRPTVAVIHDLVPYHFPDLLRPTQLRRLRRRVSRVSEQARLVACMSRFIRDHDLLQTLGLPDDKVRMIPFAAPVGFNDTTGTNTSGPPVTTDKYLFYPAGFRSYKNHRLLIEALALLTQRDGGGWKVVFTGHRRLPGDLQQLATRLRVADDVLVLGTVDRQELASLYRNAFATVVPSLYEQGSFPAIEALDCGCPVVVSGIPALREQFAGYGDAMPYLDPHDPASLPPILARIAADRQGFIAAQQAHFLETRSYTWTQAAAGWLDLLKEAAQAAA